MTRDNYCLRCNRTITIGEWYCDSCQPIYQKALDEHRLTLEDTRKEDELAEEDFTPDELAAIRSLKRLARKWPKTLMLLSMDGCLYAVRIADQGAIVTRPYGTESDVPIALIDGIHNDGGGW